MATKYQQQQPRQHDQQRNENIRKLFETKKKNLTKTQNVTSRNNTTCPRSFSYTNLENLATNFSNSSSISSMYNDNATTFKLKGSWALSQSNGQIAKQRQDVENKQQQQQQQQQQNVVFDYGSNRKLNSRRNSCTSSTPSSKIKRWHVSHKGNDVTKDMKLAKSLLGPNQLATKATEIENETAVAMATSTAALTKQHNQLVAGSTSILNTSHRHHQYQQQQQGYNANGDTDCENDDDVDGATVAEYNIGADNNCIDAFTPRLNNNYRASCPAATAITTPKARRPSEQWFKRKNWLSQDDDDMVVAAAGYGSTNDGLQTFLPNQFRMECLGNKQNDALSCYSPTNWGPTTNKNVNDHCWPTQTNSNQPENYIMFNNNNASCLRTESDSNNMLQLNATNEFSNHNIYNENVDDYEVDYNDHYNLADCNNNNNLNTTEKFCNKFQHSYDKDINSTSISKDMQWNNNVTDEHMYEHDAAVEDNVYRDKIPLGHAVMCKANKENLNIGNNKSPTNQQSSTSSPALEQLMKIHLKSKTQEITNQPNLSATTQLTNATNYIGKTFYNNSNNPRPEDHKLKTTPLPLPPATSFEYIDNASAITALSASSPSSSSSLGQPATTMHFVNVIQDSEEAGDTRQRQQQQQQQPHFMPQHQQYLPSSSRDAVTATNEHNNSKSPLLNDSPLTFNSPKIKI